MSVTVTLQELADALSVHRTSAMRKAKREGWPCAPESKGAARHVFNLTDLPRDVQKAVQSRRAKALISSPAASVSSAAVTSTAGAYALPAPAAAFCHDLTDAQRLERDARSGVLNALRRLQAEARCSQEAAIATLITSARAGRLDAVLDRMLRLARDRRGRAGDGYPSARTLKRWLATHDLAPKIPQKDLTVPPWAPGFLKHYQRPEKPTVQAAYDDYSRNVPPAERPSIHQVRRWLDKMGTVTRERGRMGSRELKNLRPFIRRDFSLLEPNDVWTADGHTFDAEVQHPLHGRPFRPEITTFVDVATRYAVGWSIDLAESATAVADSLRHGVERYGVPAIIYVDNGSGYKNAYMNAQADRICDDLQGEAALGLMGRLGSTLMHSLPYNSQARGIIERFHKTVWVTNAKRLPGYVGQHMDREARLEQFKLSRRALKSGGAMPLVPWEIFVRWCQEKIDEYNARPHRSLGQLTPAAVWARFEAKGWQPLHLDAGEAETLFRPRVTRTVGRGEIRLFNNLYFARELEEFHGAELNVAYDIHNADTVWAYAPDGRYVCSAQVNGNARHYFPVPVVEQAREKRAKGRLARVDSKREEILAELHGSPALAAPSDQIVLGGRVIDPAAAIAARRQALAQESAPATLDIAPPHTPTAPPPSRSERSAADNYAEWLALDARIGAGGAVTEDEARWHTSYQRSAQFKAQHRKTA
ncbi:MAG: transposase [Rhodocyclaceae bacterium]|nr:transposase [Rhodocyclaceae bacterium]